MGKLLTVELVQMILWRSCGRVVLVVVVGKQHRIGRILVDWNRVTRTQIRNILIDVFVVDCCCVACCVLVTIIRVFQFDGVGE